MNVIDKLPRSERPESIKRLRAIWQAGSESAARKLAVQAVRDLSVAGYDRAARCLEDGLDRCLTCYQFSEAHRPRLRTTHVIESPFAAVRLRTNAAKRFKKTKSGVYLTHEVMKRPEKRRRRLKSAHLCAIAYHYTRRKQKRLYRKPRGCPQEICTRLATTSPDQMRPIQATLTDYYPADRNRGHSSWCTLR